MFRPALLATALTLAPSLAWADDPLAGFGWFRDLAGSCWEATYPDGTTRDTQCYELQYGRFIRGTIAVERASGAPYRGDSVFAWNAKEKRMDYCFWADSGTYGNAEAYVEGKTIRFPAPDSRRTWERVDKDSFRVVQEKPDGKAWKEVLTVVYKRVKK